jgi:hypothetical protein
MSPVTIREVDAQPEEAWLPALSEAAAKDAACPHSSSETTYRRLPLPLECRRPIRGQEQERVPVPRRAVRRDVRDQASMTGAGTGTVRWSSVLLPYSRNVSVVSFTTTRPNSISWRIGFTSHTRSPRTSFHLGPRQQPARIMA